MIELEAASTLLNRKSIIKFLTFKYFWWELPSPPTSQAFLKRVRDSTCSLSNGVRHRSVSFEGLGLLIYWLSKATSRLFISQGENDHLIISVTSKPPSKYSFGKPCCPPCSSDSTLSNFHVFRSLSNKYAQRFCQCLHGTGNLFRRHLASRLTDFYY